MEVFRKWWIGKGKKRPSLEDHKHRPLEENLENKESWEEVEAIISQQTNPTVALDQDFPEPQRNKPNIPRYQTFYRSKDDVVSMEEMNFHDPPLVRRKELKEHEFTDDEMRD